MPTNQPSNAPDDLPPTPREEASPGAVLADDRLDASPGGGGLGGTAAGGGSIAGGGASPNSPIDTGVSGEGGAGHGGSKEAREAAREAIDNDPPEPHPASR